MSEIERNGTVGITARVWILWVHNILISVLRSNDKMEGGVAPRKLRNVP